MVTPALAIVLGLAVLPRHFGELGPVHFVLGGLAAAGVGLTLAAGIKEAATLPGTLKVVASVAGIYWLHYCWTTGA